jgi:hypothetical protein
MVDPKHETELANIEVELERLNELHTIRTTAEKAKRFGDLLIRAKKLIGFGNWEKWLKLRGINNRTADAWMQVAKGIQANPQWTAVSTIGDVLKLMKAGRMEQMIEKRKAYAAKAKERKVDDIHLIHGSFELLPKTVKPNSAHLAIIDPPYDLIPLYAQAAKLAQGLLREGSLALVFCGKLQIPQVIQEVSQHLRYCHCFSITYRAGQGNMLPLFTSQWVPVLVFQKGKKPLPKGIRDAHIADPFKNNRHHKWQQPRDAVHYWIYRLSNPRETVLDFCTGGGTVPLVCREVGRICYSCDIDKTCIDSTRFLLQEEEQEQKNREKDSKPSLLLSTGLFQPTLA